MTTSDRIGLSPPGKGGAFPAGAVLLLIARGLPSLFVYPTSYPLVAVTLARRGREAADDGGAADDRQVADDREATEDPG